MLRQAGVPSLQAQARRPVPTTTTREEDQAPP
jgi:hypothetical protein